MRRTYSGMLVHCPHVRLLLKYLCRGCVGGNRANTHVSVVLAGMFVAGSRPGGAGSTGSGSGHSGKPATASTLSPLQLLCCDAKGELVPWSQLGAGDDTRALSNAGIPWVPGTVDVSVLLGGWDSLVIVILWAWVP